MPFCPSCRAEYTDDMRVCADCGVPLVDALPRPEPAPDLRLVDVFRAHGEVEAQLVRSLLEANGIDCMLTGEAVRITHGFTVDGLAEVRVRVREEDAAAARDVLSASESLRDCPRCGEANPADATSCRHCRAPLESP